MSTFVKFRAIAVLAAAASSLLLVPTTASAQDERLRISFGPAVATVSGDPEFALGGTIGYRVSRQVWFEGDITWIDGASGVIPNVAYPVDPYLLAAQSMWRSALVPRPTPYIDGTGLLIYPPPYPPIGRWPGATSGSTLISTIGVRWEVPVQTDGFRPYLSTGFGLNYTDQDLNLAVIAAPTLPALPEFFATSSHAGYALTVGGGASIHFAGPLWADVDAKYYRLSHDRNTIKFGGGLSVRF